MIIVNAIFTFMRQDSAPFSKILLEITSADSSSALPMIFDLGAHIASDV